ncbi:hypothetical protein HO173_001249 [Letharia columbiana]|uniref:UspA domain-containing protein n=1 Tax=Letharia columbiana TaxID=112416 RepID=A0A8H6L9J7_9LECA|nr:uncharacterized protein HO173_001249 [Letharia columbiana]KAF6240578.1 hypothetical protein HO173_001249 [Letharia columbiana]
MDTQATATVALDASQEAITQQEAKRDEGTMGLPTRVQASNLDTIKPMFNTMSKLSNEEGQQARPESSGHHKDQRAQSGGFSEGRRKTSIEPHEAIRRGLSFGPLRKNGRRHNSTTGILKTSSKSPSSRLSQSQRRLSPSSDVLSSAEVGRLKKDYYLDDPDREAAIESSDDDPLAWSSGDEASGSAKPRGRKRDIKDSERTAPGSPLPASDGERPTVTVTGPEGEKPVSTSKRFIVRPNTNYDRNVSRGPSPSTSDSEELNDIRRAQKLNINSSPIDSSVPHRVIQTIIRGDFAQMQREAEEGTRRLRTYLVATDLSSEAAYALEWTIGTVLRDGDTLLAVYAVDEEVGTGKTGDSLPIGEGAKAMQETTAVMEKMTVASQKGPLILSKATLRPGSRKSSAVVSIDSRSRSKSNADQERAHAIETLSETCLRFLRKTKLQVRVAIEVIHCKSPKYMVTEAIDGLRPTLVIIGSRGRSALKGVLLGSFSNYLVTKSSAPVMVARKKLSGRKTKNLPPNVRLANNLTPFRRLAEAKID